MPGIRVMASSRPVYEPGPARLTFTIPTSSKGDVLLALVAHAPADAFTLPDGWTLLATDGAAPVVLSYAARMVDGSEASTLVLPLLGTSGEWQGQMLTLRGAGAFALIKETSANAAFDTSAIPALPASASLQAINLLIAAWSAAGAMTIDPPSDYASIDDYSTALTSARTFSVAARVANVAGVVAAESAEASSSATGRAFLAVLRDGLPMVPVELYDPVPGNLGLIGRDKRPPREAI